MYVCYFCFKTIISSEFGSSTVRITQKDNNFIPHQRCHEQLPHRLKPKEEKSSVRPQMLMTTNTELT